MKPFAQIITAALLGAAVLAAPAAAGDQPRIVNVKLETRSAAGGLDAAVKAFVAAQESPAWLGYAVATIDGHHEMCCWSSRQNASNCCGRCSLEGRDEGWSSGDGDCGPQGNTAKLEGSGDFVVLLRAADHHIQRVRTFSEGCTIDASGLRVLWLTDVKLAESVAVLSGLATGANYDDYRSAASGALAAIAMTADPSADRALESFITPSQPDKLRSQTAFWLGNARGAQGLRLLEGMAKNDPSTKVREQVAFAYSQSAEPKALDDLIQLAKDDPSAHVRGQGLFWLGQKAGKRAAGAITDAIENDPDTATKKSAVFALSQLPKDQGVPLLIQVAKTNKNTEVRKQAFFWLGQTNDPRALDFFEEVLKR
jgi:HEAT repeat protein